MAIEIVNFPIKHGGSFHGKMLVHQAGYHKHMGVSENSVPLHPLVNDHYPY